MAGLREQGLTQIAAAASGALSPDEELVKDPALERESAFKGEARYQAATELLFLGLHELSSSEIDLLARGHKGDKAGLAELADLFYDAKDFYRAFRIYRTHLLNSRDGRYSELGYPMKLVETIKEKAVAGSADPFLVAAVMREESHFNHRAVSPVGALGLMQIMPSTGSQIAKDLGEGFTKGRLLEPETSMRYGGWYLGQILRRFDGDAVLAVAGYNAGPNAAARWAVSLPYDTDEFVESIPYEETRGYVKRVLSSYAEFLKLGNEEFLEKVARPASENAPKLLREADAAQAENF
jgi:soluble lytic murein transglycosylase